MTIEQQIERPITSETLAATREANPGALIAVICRLRGQYPLGVLLDLLSRSEQPTEHLQMLNRPSSARIFPRRNAFRANLGRLRP